MGIVDGLVDGTLIGEVGEGVKFSRKRVNILEEDNDSE